MLVIQLFSFIVLLSHSAFVILAHIQNTLLVLSIQSRDLAMVTEVLRVKRISKIRTIALLTQKVSFFIVFVLS